jgi:hypothetical protein
VGQRQVSKGRLLRDRAQLLGALRDHRGDRPSHLPDPELALLIENIERRLATLEERLQELGGA